MKDLSDNKMLISIMKGLAEHFGDNCEFVLHDYSKDFSSSIVAIENGHITGRKVGDGGTRVGLQYSQGAKENSLGRFRYTTQTKDGKQLLSSTIFLKDEEENILGTLCINMDISEIIGLQKYVNHFLNEKPAETVVYPKVEDILVDMFRESVGYVGVSVSDMTREQKMAGIQYLNKRGAFKIRNAVNVVAKYYDISKYTIYNYINNDDINKDNIGE